MKATKTFTVIIAAFLLSLVVMYGVKSIVTKAVISQNGGKISRLVGTSAAMDWNDGGTVSLTDEATTTVTTDMLIVDSCQATIVVPAATVSPHFSSCVPMDQSVAANRGKIVLGANTVGGTASGTTTVNWSAFGLGSR